jgi:hypothetical protein
MSINQGSYVTHAQLPELGVGEIVSYHDDKMDIRFASGLKTFVYDLVVPHLTITFEAPAAAPTASKRTAKKPRKRASKKTKS